MLFHKRSLAFLILVLTTPSAQTGEKTGLGLGAKAPAFTLKDQNGKERALHEFLNKGNVALVFFRSADW